MVTQYNRILLKLSGEAFADGFGYNHKNLYNTAKQIVTLTATGVQVAIVVGAGNILRGKQVKTDLIDKTTADQMGMFATIMNAMALRDSLRHLDMNVYFSCALQIDGVVERFNALDARQNLATGKVAIIAGGTGNPYFTTDSAAALRAIELEADVLIKLTKVNGIFDKDPHQFSDAKLLPQLTYEQCLEKKIAALDTAAFVLCQENNLPIRVVSMYDADALLNLAQGKNIGSLVTSC